MANNRRPESIRQDNRPNRDLATVTSIVGSSPAAKKPHKPVPGWLKQTRDQWVEYWESDVAQIIAGHHVPAVYRLFELRDAQSRALRLYKQQPMVDGSMKQPVVNPAMATVQALEKDIRALEDRLGMSPKSQANLGIKIGQAALTAADLNRMALEDADDSGGAGASLGTGDEEPDDVVEAEWSEA